MEMIRDINASHNIFYCIYPEILISSIWYPGVSLPATLHKITLLLAYVIKIISKQNSVLSNTVSKFTLCEKVNPSVIS